MEKTIRDQKNKGKQSRKNNLEEKMVEQEKGARKIDRKMKKFEELMDVGRKGRNERV